MPKLEDSQFYLDKAIRRSLKAKFRIHIKDKREYIKKMELKRIGIIRDMLFEDFNKMLENMPKTQELNDFYLELINNNIGAEKLHENLGRISWLTKKINQLSKEASFKIEESRNEKHILTIKKGYLGRIGSLIKKVKVNVKFLDEAFKKIRNFPAIKEMYTVSICGMPNVGKSTLLNSLTGSSAEVKNYAFTTKGLMLGYIKNEGIKVQMIDNPGTLDREYDKMNSIEKQAYLVLKYLTKMIVYIFDASESSGYELEVQLKHFSTILRNFPKIELKVMINKIDISTGENILFLKNRLKEYEIMEINANDKKTLESLKEMIVKRAIGASLPP